MSFPTLVSSGFLLNEIALPILVDDALFAYTANWNWNANANDHVTNNICFTEGTQILVGAEFTEDGTFTDYVTVNIEDIEVGDLVYSYDTITGEVSQQEVTDVFVREVDHLNYLTVVDEEGNEQIIETTDSHPFWVVTDEPDLERAARSVVDENGITLYHEGVAPTDNGYWVEAKDLQEGDVFLDANGELSTLVSTERVEFAESVTVYNFTVEGNHNYFVLAEGEEQTSLLVHNAEYDDEIDALTKKRLQGLSGLGRGLEAGLNFLNSINPLGSMYEFLSGKDASDNQLSNWDRGLAGAGVGGSALATAGKVGKILNKAGNLIPEGNLANHLFKGIGKLADTPYNRSLIQSISNGKPLGIDQYGKLWYIGVDTNGRQIYSYTQNGIVKGAGYMDITVEEMINRYKLRKVQ